MIRNIIDRFIENIAERNGHVAWTGKVNNSGYGCNYR